MDNEPRVLKTDEEFKIFADPYRMRIIDVFKEAKEPLTVKAVADVLGEVPAKVHYHVMKLLSIDILILDHVEVIHGINAKYYKLVNKSFKFELDKHNDLIKDFQLSNIKQIVFNKLDSFKQDFIEKREYGKTHPEIFDNPGMISTSKVYLSVEEYKEFISMINTFIKEHDTKDDNKAKYSLLIGFTSVENK
jgi:hypothetical protein